MCDIIPLLKCLCERFYIVTGFNFNADKVYRFHEGDKEKITRIAFIHCNMPTFPKIINLHLFPNLNVLKISDSQLQTIKKSDLKGLEKIEYLWLFDNKLEYLPGDLLEDMKKLKGVSFNRNQIKYIDKELIPSLKRLDYSNFKENVNIKRYYCRDWPSSCSLEEIEKDILEKCELSDELKAIIEQQLENQLKDIIRPGGLISDFKNLLENEKTKDFTIIIQDHKFKVHKLLLMARSPLLSQMIEENPHAVQLQLEDIPIHIFEIILKFMYEDVFPPNTANFKDIFIAAGRLKIDVLKNYAVEKMIEQANGDNAFELAILSNKYEHKELRTKAFNEIKKSVPCEKLDPKIATDTQKILTLRELKKEHEDLMKKFNEFNN